MNKIETYRNLDRVNYSLLKSIIQGRQYSDSYESTALSLGSLVDCKLTTPGLFNDMFAIVKAAPGSKPKAIADDIFRMFDKLKIDPVGLPALETDTLAELINKHEYWGGIDESKENDKENKVGKLLSDGKLINYYAERLMARSKTVVDKDMIELSDRIAESIKQGDFTSCFFYPPPEIKIHYQVIVTFTVSGVECKGLIDVLLENTTDSPIQIGSYLLLGKSVLPIDIKTTGFSTLGFEKQMWKYMYQIQGAFYKYGLNQWIAKNKSGYSVADFMFIVESTDYVGKPLCYLLSKNDELIGRWGAYKFQGEYVCALGKDNDPDIVATDYTMDVLGFEQAVQLYKWHKENKKWDYPRHIYESSGLLTTNQF